MRTSSFILKGCALSALRAEQFADEEVCCVKLVIQFKVAIIVDDSTICKELELCHLDILFQDTQQRFSIKVRRVSTTWPQTQSIFCAARMSFLPHQTRTQCYPNIEAARLRTVLLKQSLWPCDYLFKLYMSCWQPYWVGPWSWQDQLFTFCTQRWNLIRHPLLLHLKITWFSTDFIW